MVAEVRGALGLELCDGCAVRITKEPVRLYDRRCVHRLGRKEAARVLREALTMISDVKERLPHIVYQREGILEGIAEIPWRLESLIMRIADE